MIVYLQTEQGTTIMKSNAHACCETNRQYSNSFLIRSSLLVSVGIMLCIPVVEDAVASGGLGQLFTLGIVAWIGLCIQKDMPEYRAFSLSIAILLCALLISPMISSLALSTAIASLSIILTAALLTVQSSRDNKIRWLFTIPSTDKIILLFVILSSCISLGGAIVPGLVSFSSELHDPLLVLGMYQISAWLKQKMQSATLPHNNGSLMVTTINKKGNKELMPASKLIKGMVVLIKHDEKNNDYTRLPVSSMVIEAENYQCIVRDTASEEVKQLSRHQTIDKYTSIYQGKVRCLESYQPIGHRQQAMHADGKDPRLKGLLAFTLGAACTVAIARGLAAGSMLFGLQNLCVNLMVSCPCVFLISKPIMVGKFKHWLESQKAVLFNKMPHSKSPNIMVFDRTGTLYTPDKSNKDRQAAYVISDKNIALLRELSSTGVRCIVLSGHGTMNYKDHHDQCIQQLRGIVAPNDIIFDKRYHDAKIGRKEDVIHNLQHYGSVSKPKMIWQKIRCRIQAIVKNNTVGMVGDGGNDIAAMHQSDLAIAITPNLSSVDDKVFQAAHFVLESSEMDAIKNLSVAAGVTHFYYELFLWLGLSYNTVMLMLVNGLYEALTGAAFPASSACLAMSIFCPSVLLLASCVRIKPPETSRFRIANSSISTLASSISKPCDDNKSTCPNDCTQCRAKNRGSNFSPGNG